MTESIGERVAALIPARGQGKLADAIGMAPDALSRALSGQRNFSSGELARIADHYAADLHELITGEPDPNRIVIAARHTYDRDTRERSVPTVEEDRRILQDVALAYHQGEPAPSGALLSLSGVDEVRDRLGADFVRPFVDRIEGALGIDVVRVKELSTAYSMTSGPYVVIAIPATGSWFWENWSLAHELGHLVYGHHAGAGVVPKKHEQVANAFAADLLMPREMIRGYDWSSMTESDLADLVWELGVSTQSLAIRLETLCIASPAAERWRYEKTQRLLHRHWHRSGKSDEITDRMRAASARRFPRALEEAHQDRIAAGQLHKGTLAWMLGVDAEALEVDEPERRELSSDDLAAALGIA
ncbi:ImmA/IrrE family metallo-endopeptidase [Tsukamurella strandjordii]|uniref:helix-turn-helix domain-containing protein n=1 Tax=Tsukamurella TaxID=2060 RepID=UPI001C7DBEE7|nr:XRE family transcriptional regulator [Tsukamurella sp. TY48]GIZ97552.1 hypothetical protein TTY48_21640 [Tsukamurella sp. TY48]